eukprot:CAMPEP_0206482160 /NCGR_PEP_ID=MMETSP0324_2-20121206/38699_1 /ASSEMBLY_ACC=CAM_ASM_000836 /TAXON_ID=2866 /ORGANISM="Crypthecodinium cohnii, Strain Seligo" /LENGTH=63 /DNA_ID=CAMNT_0053960035 /DNA_START=709 /DNA_END=896 /DNA_ORIENTATION=+
MTAKMAPSCEHEILGGVLGHRFEHRGASIGGEGGAIKLCIASRGRGPALSQGSLQNGKLDRQG